MMWQSTRDEELADAKLDLSFSNTLARLRSTASPTLRWKLRAQDPNSHQAMTAIRREFDHLYTTRVRIWQRYNRCSNAALEGLEDGYDGAGIEAVLDTKSEDDKSTSSSTSLEQNIHLVSTKARRHITSQARRSTGAIPMKVPMRHQQNPDYQFSDEGSEADDLSGPPPENIRPPTTSGRGLPIANAEMHKLGVTHRASQAEETASTGINSTGNIPLVSRMEQESQNFLRSRGRESEEASKPMVDDDPGFRISDISSSLSTAVSIKEEIEGLPQSESMPSEAT